MAKSEAMLLSTFAVLIILTHQEETHQKETLQGAESSAISRRVPMVEVSEYEQPWRAVNVQLENEKESWTTNHTQEHNPRRRRPGRKRRRRPAEMRTEATEDHTEAVGLTGIRQEELESMYENIEQPRRRRKRPGAVYTEDEPSFHRQNTHRRRGNRRRQRPYLPDLENTQREFPVELEGNPENDENSNMQAPLADQQLELEELTTSNKQVGYDEVMEMILPESDRSTTSDFLHTNPKYKINDRVKYDKSYRVSYGLSKTQTSNEPSSSYIKQLLKKADGLSLSELLQKHNLTLTDLISGKTKAIEAIKEVTTRSEETSQEGITYLPEASKEKVDDNIGNDAHNESQSTHEITTVKGEDTVGHRKFQPLHLNKLNSSLEEQLLKENQQAGTSRRRLPPIPSRKNLRQRMRPHRNLTSLRTHLKRKPLQTTTMTVLTETELEDNSGEVAFETTTIHAVNTPETTTPTESGNILEIIEHVDIENQVIQETTPKVIIPALRPKPKYISTNSELRKRLQSQKNQLRPAMPKSAIKISLDEMVISHLVSASEFITQTNAPRATSTTSSPDDDDLPDMFPEPAIQIEHESKENIIPGKNNIKDEMEYFENGDGHVEDLAKDELFEILNDTTGGARLSKILRDRKMSLKELVQQRERGSSQIHLADIFHNASKEPNPPEPFLSKSLLEPMSRETYPLKALLEGSVQEPNFKKPETGRGNGFDMLLNYGKNINENGDLFGLVSLFYGKDENRRQAPNQSYTSENFKDARASFEKPSTVYTALIVSSTAAPAPPANVEINEIVDIDGDGVIILEDLQQQQESAAEIQFHSKYSKLPNSIRSVTIATSVVMGLSAVVFLMTYLACKWRINRRNRKENVSVSRTTANPKFEGRKISKNHSSSRSLSPMLTATTIYTVSGTDSGNGKESPDYGWGNLRVPYQ